MVAAESSHSTSFPVDQRLPVDRVVAKVDHLLGVELKEWHVQPSGFAFARIHIRPWMKVVQWHLLRVSLCSLWFLSGN